MQSQIENTIPNKIWLTVVALFGLSLLTSKSALTGFAVILIFWAFISPSQRNQWIYNKRVLYILSLFPIAIILNLFSKGGWESSYKIIISWPWTLLAAPTMVIFNNIKSRKYFLYALCAGLIIADVYSIYLLIMNLTYNVEVGFMTENFRIGSFWKIGRWGMFSGFAVLCLFLLVNDNFEIKYKKAVLFLLGFTSVPFLLTNTRGPLIGLVIVLSIMSFTSLRFFKNVTILFILIFSFFLSNESALNRIKSIFLVDYNAAKVTSSNQSNASRLDMWRVGLDFFRENPWFGTGFESTKQPLMEFLEKKDESYLDSFAKKEFSYNDQHSSYLNILVQMGLLFFVYCWCGIFSIFLTELKKYLKDRNPNNQFYLAGIGYCLIVFIFYSAFNSYEAILFVVLLTLLGQDFNKNTSN